MSDHLLTTFGPLPFDRKKWNDAERARLVGSFKALFEECDPAMDCRMEARLHGERHEQDATLRILAAATTAFEAFCVADRRKFDREISDLRSAILRLSNEAYMKGFNEGFSASENDRREMAEARAKKTCYVYFIRSGAGEIKIGQAIDVQKRLAGLQTSHPHQLTLLATTDGGKPAERAYHARFAEHRLHGEWFAPHPDILAEIERLNA